MTGTLLLVYRLLAYWILLSVVVGKYKPGERKCHIGFAKYKIKVSGASKSKEWRIGKQILTLQIRE